jgi:hypothetical protein
LGLRLDFLNALLEAFGGISGLSVGLSDFLRRAVQSTIKAASTINTGLNAELLQLFIAALFPEFAQSDS